jgi:phosphate transport system substrate-binding protein
MKTYAPAKNGRFEKLPFRLNSSIALVLLTLITFCAIFPACVSKKKREQTISLSGAFALYPLVVRWADEYKKVNPDVRFNISGGGAGKGMADALSGAVDLGMFSREITPEEKARGVWWTALTIDAVLPTINAKNPHLPVLKKRGLTRDEFRVLFMSNSVTDWFPFTGITENTRIMVYTRSDACGAAETWAKYLGGHQEDLDGIGIYGDPGLAEAVVNDIHGVGFNNTIFIYDINTGRKRPGIEVIPIDINGNGKIDPEEDIYDSFQDILQAIAAGMYPSPPARELYFVSNGFPKKQSVIDFIRWTLTDGQKFVTEAGYVPLDQETINAELTKIPEPFAQID